MWEALPCCIALDMIVIPTMTDIIWMKALVIGMTLLTAMVVITEGALIMRVYPISFPITAHPLPVAGVITETAD
jgi:hypothetical protein